MHAHHCSYKKYVTLVVTYRYTLPKKILNKERNSFSCSFTIL